MDFPPEWRQEMVGEPAAQAKGEPPRTGNTPLALGSRRGLAVFSR